MLDMHIANVQSSYDRVADEYAQRIYDELRHKPLDRELLDRLADQVRGRGRVCDLGCGPGHIARYLHERGVPVVGVDLSPEMIARARQLNPEITFIEGNMLALEVPDRAWAGIAAFYSIIHIPRANVVQALREMKRVLQPGGVLLIAFHIGDQTVHLDEWWGKQVSVDFFFFQTREMLAFLQTASFATLEVIERDPYPGVEHQSRRAYIFARNAEAESTPVRTDL
jgi:ubiquinone/menaquinone biosynthesis C-methylase UbiE